MTFVGVGIDNIMFLSGEGESENVIPKARRETAQKLKY